MLIPIDTIFILSIIVEKPNVAENQKPLHARAYAKACHAMAYDVGIPWPWHVP